LPSADALRGLVVRRRFAADVAETYTSGIWKVKPGHDAEFVEAWKDFVRWASEQTGSGTFRLVRDVEDPSHYLSFAPWESFESQNAWKQTAEFSARMTNVRQHVESFEPSTYELVAEV
jgi:heme-degrading monooxygenase HmoA